MSDERETLEIRYCQTCLTELDDQECGALCWGCDDQLGWMSDEITAPQSSHTTPRTMTDKPQQENGTDAAVQQLTGTGPTIGYGPTGSILKEREDGSQYFAPNDETDPENMVIYDATQPDGLRAEWKAANRPQDKPAAPVIPPPLHITQSTSGIVEMPPEDATHIALHRSAVEEIKHLLGDGWHAIKHLFGHTP